MTSTIKTGLATAMVLAAALFTAAAHSAPDFTVKQRWALADAGRWDYLDIDTVRHRLFLSRGDRVQVLELPSGKVIGEIAGTAGVHGVAFAQDLKLGFTSNGRGDSVTVFDLETMAVKQEVKVSGSNPDAILYEPTSHKLYTFNGKTANVTVLDAVSLKVLNTISVAGKPEFAVTDNAGKVYVNIEDKSEINVIDVASDKVIAKWPLAGCSEPTGIALDEPHARLFSVCQNKVMVVTNTANGQHVADVVIGERPDAAVYDAKTATVFSSNGDGSLSAIHQVDADQYIAQNPVITEKGARTMAMDHAGQQIYLPVISNKVFTVLVVGP